MSDTAIAPWAEHLFEWGREQRKAERGSVMPAVTPTRLRPAPATGDDDEPRAISDPQAYALRALDGAVDEMCDATEGSRNHTLNAIAYSLGRLVAADLLGEADVVERLSEAASEAGLDSSEIPGTLASGLYAGMAHPLPWVHAPAEHVALLRPFEPERQHDGVAVGLGDDQLLTNELRLQRARREAKRILDAEERGASFTEPSEGWRGDLFIAEADEPEVWLFDQVLPYGANATLTAPFKTGKTTFMVNLLTSLLSGEPLCGKWPLMSTAGNVAVWDFEMTKRQYRRWLRDVDARGLDRLFGHTLRGQALDLLTDEATDWAIRWLAGHHVGVWIIDPFARAFKDDENDNGLVTRWTDHIDVIKEQAGVHTFVMPVHTGRREGEDVRARGATRLDDWPDVRWILRKDDAERRLFRATGRDVLTDECLLHYDEANRRYTASDRPASEETLNEIGEKLWAALPWYEPGVPGMNQGQAYDALGVKRSGGNAGKLDAALHWIRTHKALEAELQTPSNGKWQLWKRRL